MTPPIKMSGSIERPSTQLASPTDKAVPLAPDFDAGWVAESDAGPRRAQQAEHTPVSGRKNVCLISSSRNATEHRILSKQAVSLVRAGYRVVIIAVHPRDENVSGIEIKAVPKFESRFSRIVRATRFVYREALRQRADIYHFHNLELIPVGWLLKFRGKRVIYDVREDTPADLRDKFWIPRLLRPLIANAVYLVEKLSGRVFDGIVTTTHHISERFPKGKTAVVQNFPLLDETFPADRPYLERAPVVLFIGTIDPPRGVLDLVEAMGLLPETLDARLVIGGKFETPGMEQEARNKAGWNRTDYTGWQDREGLLHLLGRARIGVLPFRSAANLNNAQPIKLFEYMLAGIPVLASDLPRQAEIVKDAQCGILVKPNQPQALADAIQWLLEHPVEAQAMGARGREAVLRNYNWSSQARLLLELYHKVIS